MVAAVFELERAWIPSQSLRSPCHPSHYGSGWLDASRVKLFDNERLTVFLTDMTRVLTLVQWEGTWQYQAGANVAFDVAELAGCSFVHSAAPSCTVDEKLADYRRWA
ncbi:hypothetical protein P3T76_002411 [Phytophthora citrophthora]|uniref:Uncharacterized protein n=1 Tax=Phytophthora citrophthora TaxID=4793 RepID=A0AAD9GXF6_9STRA|nr:hypothetical protein P3T76_002411 [Phytophthora citrophthora]